MTPPPQATYSMPPPRGVTIQTLRLFRWHLPQAWSGDSCQRMRRWRGHVISHRYETFPYFGGLWWWRSITRYLGFALTFTYATRQGHCQWCHMWRLMVAANCIMFACSRLIYRCAGVFVGMRSIVLGFSLDTPECLWWSPCLLLWKVETVPKSSVLLCSKDMV